ncbi:hypothetical protein ONZ45_g11512 [Pleurotus djamor]|nr:hypothetical protein ONZ45_g11512 [Pleurotus djamor]
MSSQVSVLRQLSDLISKSVSQIDGTFEKAGLAYPSLDAPFNPTSPAEALVMSPDLLLANQLIVAACAQLSATIGSPASALFDLTSGSQVTGAFRAVVETNTVEILRGHPEGLHVKQISEANGIAQNKLARILRLLCTFHLFREVSPNVFSNNRISSLLDTGKSVDAIKADPINKHTNSPGLAAGFEHMTNTPSKGAANLKEVLTHPKLGPSELPEDAAVPFALNYPKPVWEWFEEPENEAELKKFTMAMATMGKMEPPNAILGGFKWGDLPAGATIVDVGGGLGHNTLSIAKEHRHLKCVVQDRAAVIEQAKVFWQENLPEALTDGTIQLQAHDFFAPQPVKNADVYWARAIVHDWGKSKAVEILSHLRAAAKPETKLVIIERIIPYACLPDEEIKKLSQEIPGSELPQAPQPLLPNFGRAGASPYLADVHLLIAMNGEERTLASMVDLAASAGWKIIEVIKLPGSMNSHIVAVPIAA